MGSRVIWSKCQGNDSLAYVNGNGRNVDYVEGSGEDAGLGPVSSAELDAPLEEEEEGQAERKEAGSEIGLEELSVDELKELLHKASKELEVAKINSTMFEEKVKKISETAISLHDEAVNSWNNVNSTLDTIQEIENEEHTAKEAVQNATMALSLAEARLQVAIETLEAAKEVLDSAQGSNESNGDKDMVEEEQALLVAQEVNVRVLRITRGQVTLTMKKEEDTAGLSSTSILLKILGLRFASSLWMMRLPRVVELSNLSFPITFICFKNLGFI